MNDLTEARDFDIGPWRVRPSRSELEGDGTAVRLEPRVMSVLLALARHPGETVPRERLIAEVWDGRAVTDDAVHRCIAALRKVLRSQPGADIETLPKLGYVLRVAKQSGANQAAITPDGPTAPAATSAPSAATTPATEQGRTGPLGRSRAWWPLLAVALAAVGPVVLWWSASDSPGLSSVDAAAPALDSTGPTRRSVPLTSAPGREVQPALSPSGGHVAYVRARAGGLTDLVVTTVDGAAELVLTRGEARDRHPVWSADGSEIAFVRSREGRCELMRISALGGAARSIAACGPGELRSLDWSPDGRTLAITRASDDLAPAQLQLIDRDSGAARTVSAIEALDANIEDAHFNADGSALAFTAGRALGVEDVHLYGFADRSIRRLTHDRLKVHGLDFSDDGQSVVYSSNRSGPFRLWWVALDGSEPQPLGGAGDAADDPSTASNGRVAYEVWQENAEIVSVSLADAQAPERVLAPSTRFEWDAQRSPDGRRLAFISDRSGAAEVWMSAADGSAPQQQTSFRGAYTHSPRWSPDGERLAFVSPANGRMNLFVMAPNDPRPRRIGAEDVDYFAPSWAADGKAVLAGGRGKSGPGGEDLLWAVPIDTGVPQRLGPEGARTPRLSPDGTMLYYTKAGIAGLWRAPISLSPIADQGETRVIDELTPVDWNNWVVLPTSIYYVRRDPGAEPRLVRLDLTTGERRVLRDLPGLLYKSGLWVSGDERELIATRVVTAEADIHLLN